MSSVAALLSAGLIVVAAAAGAAQGADGAIELRIQGVRSAAGAIEIDVIAPGRRNVLTRRIAARTGTVRVALPVPPGAYGVLLYHDENGNGRLDRGGLFGMPTEGYAFSNDAPVRLGPPSFESMRIAVAPGARAVAPVRMRYPRGRR